MIDYTRLENAVDLLVETLTSDGTQVDRKEIMEEVISLVCGLQTPRGAYVRTEVGPDKPIPRDLPQARPVIHAAEQSPSERNPDIRKFYIFVAALVVAEFIIMWCIS